MKALASPAMSNRPVQAICWWSPGVHRAVVCEGWCRECRNANLALGCPCHVCCPRACVGQTTRPDRCLEHQAPQDQQLYLWVCCTRTLACAMSQKANVAAMEQPWLPKQSKQKQQQDSSSSVPAQACCSLLMICMQVEASLQAVSARSSS
jgi:hypothetical protein